MPNSFSIEVKGLDNLISDMHRMGSQFPVYIKDAMNRSTLMIKEDARRIGVGTFKNQTGNLRRRITRKVENNGFSGVVYTDVNYAPYVEMGTRPHIIKPKNKRMLAFKVDGRMVFAKLVHHPGFKGFKFFENAFTKNMPKVINLFSDAMLKTIRVVGK